MSKTNDVPTMVTMTYEVSLSADHQSVLITGSLGEHSKILKVARPVYEVLTSLGDKPVANVEVQIRMARAMQWELKDGRCPRAASILEKVTPGYAKFNGWCALLTGAEEGRSRFFTTNTNFWMLKDASMITRQWAPNSGQNTHNSLPGHGNFFRSRKTEASQRSLPHTPH